MKPAQRRAADAGESAVRERLIEAASAVIAAEGTSAASSRAISERAGENLASITYYFGSKDALVSEALLRHARQLLQPVLDELASARSPAEKLMAAVHLLSEVVAAQRDELSAYLECLARSSHDEQLAGSVRSLSRDVRRLLAQEMSLQQQQGLIPAWVDPSAMASLIVALASGVVAETVIDPDQTDPGAIGRQFAGLLLAARANGPAS